MSYNGLKNEEYMIITKMCKVNDIVNWINVNWTGPPDCGIKYFNRIETPENIVIAIIDAIT